MTQLTSESDFITMCEELLRTLREKQQFILLLPLKINLGIT